MKNNKIPTDNVNFNVAGTQTNALPSNYIRTKSDTEKQKEAEAAFESFFNAPSKEPSNPTKKNSLEEAFDEIITAEDEYVKEISSSDMIEEDEDVEELLRSLEEDVKNLPDRENRTTLVVNLYAGPGSGKSKMASGIFFELKSRGINCELVTEFAKELTWEERSMALNNQIHIFGEQHHRIFRLLGKVDVIITDAPLLFTPIYDMERRVSLKELALNEYNKMRNYNVFVVRKQGYNPAGRKQDYYQSLDLDYRVSRFLNENYIPYVNITGDVEGKDYVVRQILNIINR